MTATRQRKARPIPPPRFAAGDVVRTRAAVKVKCPGLRGRRWLYLLPGTDWVVVEVLVTTPDLDVVAYDPAAPAKFRGRPRYRLATCGVKQDDTGKWILVPGKYECVKREFVLRTAPNPLAAKLEPAV